MTPAEFKIFVEGLLAGADTEDTLSVKQVVALREALARVEMPPVPPNDGKTYPLPYNPPIPYQPFPPLTQPGSGDPLYRFPPIVTCGLWGVASPEAVVPLERKDDGSLA